jgi:hypothetical protein
MGTTQGTSMWAHPKGVWVLSKGWRTVPTTFGDLPKGNVSFGYVFFDSGKAQA